MARGVRLDVLRAQKRDQEDCQGPEATLDCAGVMRGERRGRVYLPPPTCCVC